MRTIWKKNAYVKQRWIFVSKNMLIKHAASMENSMQWSDYMTNTEAQSRDLYGHFTKLKSVFKKGCFFYLYSIIGGNLFVLCAFKQSIIMIKVGYEKGGPYPAVSQPPPPPPAQLNPNRSTVLFVKSTINSSSSTLSSSPSTLSPMPSLSSSPSSPT